jgi:hypothetical protein
MVTHSSSFSCWYRSATLLLSLVVLPAAAQGDAKAKAPVPPMGLKFADPAQLQGIPLASTPFAGQSLPPKVDLSGDLPPPGNQGKQQSCVGWAVAYALKSYHEKVEEKLPVVDAAGNPNTARVFSPAFIYNQINNGRDGGSLFIDAFNILSQKGAAPWAKMPYQELDFLSVPTAEALADAQRYRIDYWRQVNVRDVKEVKAQLHAGYPVVIGAMVDDGFIASPPGSIWSAPGGASHGGHAMLVVGYDDARSAFKVINSWGQNWGDRGYGWIAYGFFSMVVREGYVVKDASNGPGPAPVPMPNPVQPSPNPVQPSPNPVPAPLPVAQADFQITNILHNQFNPSAPNLGPGMVFQGTLTIPPGHTGIAQIVILMRFAAPPGVAAMPIRSTHPAFATVHGVAATGTAPQMIPPQGAQVPWMAFFPYYSLDVKKGVMLSPMGQPMGFPITTFVQAEPTLFINNFGVKTGMSIPFTVAL